MDCGDGDGETEAAYLLMLPGAVLGALGFSLTASVGRRSCQGQEFRAATVSVVSSELEKVRTEQYHCQGLSAVIQSCGSQSQAIHAMTQSRNTHSGGRGG